MQPAKSSWSALGVSAATDANRNGTQDTFSSLLPSQNVDRNHIEKLWGELRKKSIQKKGQVQLCYIFQPR